METKSAKRKTALLAAALAAGACLPGWGAPPLLTGLDAASGAVSVRGRGTADACYELQWSPALGETANWLWAGEMLARTNGVFEMMDEIFARPGFYRVSEKETMSAKSVLRIGSAQGMDAYSRMLWNDRIVMPAGKADCEIYLSGDTKDSGGIYGDRIGKEVDLLGRNATKERQRAYLWLPSRYWDVPVEYSQWIYQKAYDSSARKNRLVGRYAYAIFDVSGGIDVNLLACYGLDGYEVGITNRSNIRDFTEAAANSLEEVLSIDGIGSQVERYGGFDSFQAMRKNLSRYIDLENLNNLVPYSKSVFRGTSYRVASGDWTIPVDSAKLSQSDWENLLVGQADETRNRSAHTMQDTLKGLTDADRVAIAKAIMDFTSTNIAPQGLDYPSVKDVPMLNETKLEIKLVEEPHDGGEDKPAYSTYKLVVTLDLETWFPFPSSKRKGARFKIPAPVLKLVRGAGGGGDNSLAFRYAFTGISGYTYNRPDFELQANDYTFTADWNEGKPQKMPDSFKYELDIKATCTGNGWSDNEPGHLPQGLTLVLQPQGTTKFSVEYDNVPVDEAELTLVNVELLQLKQGNEYPPFSLEVPDPRMNHIPDLWIAGEEGGSLGDWNDSAKRAIKENLGIYSPQAGDFAMFCRNGPLETPGDLGFIPVIGASKYFFSARKTLWKTLDLYSLDASWLMRQLASKTEAVSSLPVYTNGTINPNTPLTNVLTAAFSDLTAMGIPDWDHTTQNKKKLTASEVKTIAARIIGYRSKGEYDTEESLGQGYDFASGSDWVTAFADARWHKVLEDLFDRPKNVREGLIRQTWSLFRPEDNLFVMVVIGQGIQEGPTGTLGAFNEADDEIVGEKREVLLVWRDPFPVGCNQDFDMQIISRTELGD